MAFAVIAYVPSFGVPFVFDDLHNLVLNPRIQPGSFADLAESLDARGSRDRPVAMVTFALNYLWSGLDPRSYHAVNLAIHALNGVLLYLLLRILARAPGSPSRLQVNTAAFAFAGALIWVVHPVNTQAVTYIVQRMASLAATFYLIALWLFALWRSGKLSAGWALPGIGLAFLVGFFTKAHVVTLPVALLLVDVTFFGGWRRVHTWALAATAALAVALGGLYAGPALEHLLTAPPYRDFSGLERLMTQSRVIWHYLSLLAWPDADRLQLDYDFTISRTLLDPPVTLVASVGLLLVTLAAAYFLRRHPWPAFGWLFFLVALSVESSIILLEIAFEHRLYLPAALLLPAVIAPLYGTISNRRAVTWLSVAMFALAGVLTLQTLERNAQWADLGTLWSEDLNRGASPFRATLNGARRLAQQGRPQEALSLLRRAPPELDRSEEGRLRLARGEILFMLERYEDALAEIKGALELYPAWSRAAYVAGQCLIQLGRIDDAGSILEQLRANVPQSVFPVLLESELARARGDREEAAQILRQFLAQQEERRVPARNVARLHLANVYRAQGRTEAAAAQYRAIVRDDPKQWAAWASLYHMLRAGGDREQAARVARYLQQHGVDPDAWAPSSTVAFPGGPAGGPEADGR